MLRNTWDGSGWPRAVTAETVEMSHARVDIVLEMSHFCLHTVFDFAPLLLGTCLMLDVTLVTSHL